MIFMKDKYRFEDGVHNAVIKDFKITLGEKRYKCSMRLENKRRYGYWDDEMEKFTPNEFLNICKSILKYTDSPEMQVELFENTFPNKSRYLLSFDSF